MHLSKEIIKFICVYILILQKFIYCYTTNEAKLNNTITNISEKLNELIADPNDSVRLNEFNILAQQVIKKYDGKNYALLPLIHILENKLRKIEQNQNTNVTTHILQLQDGMQLAIDRTPFSYYRCAYKYVTTLPKKQLTYLLSLNNSPQTDETVPELLVKRATRWPILEKFLRNLSLYVSLLAVIADACTNIPVGLCQVSLFLVTVALGFWIVDLTKTILGGGP